MARPIDGVAQRLDGVSSCFLRPFFLSFLSDGCVGVWVCGCVWSPGNHRLVRTQSITTSTGAPSPSAIKQLDSFSFSFLPPSLPPPPNPTQPHPQNQPISLLGHNKQTGTKQRRKKRIPTSELIIDSRVGASWLRRVSLDGAREAIDYPAPICPLSASAPAV